MSQSIELNYETNNDMPAELALRVSAPEIDGAFPLSPVQAGMLFHSLYAPEAGLYLEQIVLKIDGEIGDKKMYDPRSYLKAGEKGVADRMAQACDDLLSSGKSICGKV